MKYIGEFYNINDILYKIEIETKKSGSDKEIKLSGTPFVSTIENDKDNIYSPIKCGGSTVGLLTDYYIEDLYTGESKGVKVTLINETESNKVEWVGYVTPSCYSQNFDYELEELQLDCIDGIAVLKNIKYLQNGEREIKTFADIIGYCLNQSGCFDYLYITDNVQLNSTTSNDSVIEIFRISESGLFEKKDDITEPDENVAWSCYDVLYQICQYLGYTLITEGNNVIILDYDAIKRGNNTYFRYNINGDKLTNKTTTTLSFNYHINGESYSQNGTTIELTPVYNKVTVVDDFLEFEGEDASQQNITAKNDPYFNEAWIEGTGIGNWYDACDTIIEKDDFGNDLTYQICFNKLHSDNWVYTVVKYYTNSKYKFYRYSLTGNFPQNRPAQDGVGFVMNSRGATYCKYCHIDADIDKWHNSFLFKNKNNLNSYSMEQRKGEWIRLLNSQFANLNFKDCIVMMNPRQGGSGHISVSSYDNSVERASSVGNPDPNEPYQNYPFWEYEDNNPAIFGSKNAQVYIKGTITSHDEWWNPWPMNNGKDNDDLQFDKKQKDLSGMFCWTKFQWGDKWFNGDGWQESECFFKLYWWQGIKEKIGGNGRIEKIGRFLYRMIGWNEHWNKRWFDKDIPLVDLDAADYVVGEDAIVINAPQEGNLNGKIKFTMYCPRDIWDSNKKRCDRYYTCVQCLTDFEIEGRLNTGGSLGDDSMLDSDTCYTNITENGALEEMEEIEFKICTFDNKNPSYSLVDYKDNEGNSKFIDTTYNKANYNGEGQPMRQEEHLVYKLVTQYKDPKLIFNCNLKLNNINPKLYGLYTDETLSDKKYIIDGCEFDYRFGKASLKLIEKA